MWLPVFFDTFFPNGIFFFDIFFVHFKKKMKQEPKLCAHHKEDKKKKIVAVQKKLSFVIFRSHDDTKNLRQKTIRLWFQSLFQGSHEYKTSIFGYFQVIVLGLNSVWTKKNISKFPPNPKFPIVGLLTPDQFKITSLIIITSTKLSLPINTRKGI